MYSDEVDFHIDSKCAPYWKDMKKHNPLDMFLEALSG